MNHPVIKVRSLAKQYHFGAQQNVYHTLGESLTKTFKRRAREKTGEQFANNCFWALKDVSFDVRQGEVVGIVGRNGAGKSTLLKILSRITEPSAGCIDIYGRVGSLLEVGTGFHYELTGRENIFLSGAILGMKKAEIAGQFDEIVAFAEIEKFVDTPVKHYSSGMYLRLAFGVAAHLQPNILLIDEVLAVGDQVFQKKCLGKMGDVAKQGRTILFVSHNMSAITELCTRGLLIKAGQLAFDGTAVDCVSEYYKSNNAVDALETDDAGGRQVPLQVHSLKLNDGETTAIETGEAFEVSLAIRGRAVRNPLIFFIIENVSNQLIVHKRINSKDLGLPMIDGSHLIKIRLPGLWLAPGVYSMYFKFIVPATDWSGRLQSERILLEVRGELERTGRAILNPEAQWKLDSAEQSRTPETIFC